MAAPRRSSAALALPVVLGPPVSFDLYLSHDGGASRWPSTPMRAGSPLPDAFSLTPDLTRAWLDSTVYATENAAGSRRRPAHLRFAGQPEMDVLTPRTGVALGMVNGWRDPAWIRHTSMDRSRTWQTAQSGR